jgi:hypothetical protein
MKRIALITLSLALAFASCASSSTPRLDEPSPASQTDVVPRPTAQEQALQKEAYDKLLRLISGNTPQKQWVIINENIELARLAWGKIFEYNYWSYECWKTGTYIVERPAPSEEYTPEQIKRIQYLDANSFWYEPEYRKAMEIQQKEQYIQEKMLLWSNKDYVAGRQKETQKDCSLGYEFWLNEYYVLQKIVLDTGRGFQINDVLVRACNQSWQEIASAYSMFRKAGMKFED